MVFFGATRVCAMRIIYFLVNIGFARIEKLNVKADSAPEYRFDSNYNGKRF